MTAREVRVETNDDRIVIFDQDRGFLEVGSDEAGGTEVDRIANQTKGTSAILSLTGGKERRGRERRGEGGGERSQD
jgi:hypothetical protein